MTVFQYCGNIYYRAFKHIPEGRELLVWYDEKYSEFIDIPALISKGHAKGEGQLLLLYYSYWLLYTTITTTTTTHFCCPTTATTTHY